MITDGVETAGGIAPSGRTGGGSSAALGLGGTGASVGNGGRELSPLAGGGGDWFSTGALSVTVTVAGSC